MTNRFHIIPPIVAAVMIGACSPSQDYQKIQGETMGTSYHISFGATQANTDEIKAAIDTRLAAINQSMSTYIDNSTISQFNQAKPMQMIAIDDDFAQVLQDSRTIYQASHGSFDPTVYPLVELWGFGSKMSIDRLQSPPTQSQIDAAKATIGLSKVKSEDKQIYKTQDGVGLDFSAIAKGYAVDVIADVLQTNYKIDNYMVEIGGEVATKGKNAQGKPWTLAVDKPEIDSAVKTRQSFTTITQAENGSLHIATSGGYRNSVVLDGLRYSHTINAATGKPVSGSAVSVTVLADTVAKADGWATALTAVDAKTAIKMANDNHIQALFILEDDKDAHKFTLVKSHAFVQQYGQ